MQNLLGDIRYSLRQFRLSPVCTATAVLTLALGIGGTTAIFSLMHALMLRSLPVADPASLYRIGDGTDCCVEGGPQGSWGMYSLPLFERLKAAAPEFEELTAFQSHPWDFAVRREGTEHQARALRGEFVTGNYFSTFGVRSFAGRLFSPNDDRLSAEPVAVLSYHVWSATYGGDPSVIGSSFVVEGHPFTVIGIAPPGFFGETLRSDPPEIWMPLQQEPLITGPSSLLRQSISAWLRVIGRLRPGATIDGMSARLTTVLRQWLVTDSGYPANWMAEIKRLTPKQTITVVPAGAGVAEMKENYGDSLQILLAVCGLVLVIACANVANLLLARAMARRSQTSVRLAIGASARQIVSQSLVESVLLALIGGLAGLAVAVGAARLLLALAFHRSHFLPVSTAPSLPVLGFAFLLALVTGIVFGTAPAWFATHSDPVEALRGSGRSTRDSSSLARKALLIVQATLSVVLVAGAAMLTRSLSNLEHQDFGFATQNRVSVDMDAPPPTYSIDRLNAVYRALQERLIHLPGVETAALALYNPLHDNWGELILIPGRPAPHFSEEAGASWDRVTPSYFAAFGEPILHGRGFTDTDNETTAPVAIVNQAFVKKFFPNEDPIDKHFGMDMPAYAGTFRIVGVVRDARYKDFDHPVRPMFYVPLAQSVHYNNELMQTLEFRSHFINSVILVARSGPGVLEPLLRKALADVDPNLTITGVSTMQEELNSEFDQQRAVASLAGLFGFVALILAAVGLYGVTAYSVEQRTNEIGVRMALGADRFKVMQLVLSGAFRRVILGLLIGVPLAIGAGRLIAAKLYLYEVHSWDPLALSTAVLALVACAFAAAIIPAWRAASIAPIEALRTE